jgi:hypothetical protein
MELFRVNFCLPKDLSATLLTAIFLDAQVAFIPAAALLFHWLQVISG